MCREVGASEGGENICCTTETDPWDVPFVWCYAADDDDDDDDDEKKSFKFNETKIQLVSFLSLKVNRYTHLTINEVVLREKANVIFCFVSDLWNTFRGKSSSSVEKLYLFRPFHMEIFIVIFTRIKSTKV